MMTATPAQHKYKDVPLEYIAFSKLRAFAKALNPQFDTTPYHIKRIASALQQVERGAIKRLMISCPPRHGKSMLTSEMFPAWYFGRNPEKNIIFATYGQDFAEEFGRKVRNHITDPLYNMIFPTTMLADDSAAAKKFSTTRGGSYYAVGMGAAITGRGAHCLIIDDPIKNHEEADSSLIRQRIKDWYSSTAYTRLEPDGAIIIIQTRWHNDDLSGWLLHEKKEPWHVISLPAITRNEQGIEQALWPERYSIENLTNIRNTVSSRDWAALYMQTPILDGGNVFKEAWLQYYREELNLNEMNIYVFVDPANSKDKESDNTAIVVIGANKDGHLYLIDAWVDKLNIKERENLVFKIHEKYQPKMIYYEKYGMQIDIDYMRQAMEYRNYRFSITEVGGNKMKKNDRIERLAPLFEDGKIWLPLFLKKKNYLGREVDLVTYFKDEEYTQFPAGKHDDFLDAFARVCDVPIMYPKKSKLNYYELYR
jgi:predicted phage terminase large subunit-like protein